MPEEDAQPYRKFTLLEIEEATDDFDNSKIIGHGGFGDVYRGKITVGENKDKLDVAIKRSTSVSEGIREFLAELEILSLLSYEHLVRLIGYYSDEQQMIIVYEYIPNGSLSDRLHKRRYPPLTWVRRLNICLGVALGLDHLHTLTGMKGGVIHRDVKSANILLDSSFRAKISDFGLSKIGPPNQTSDYARGTHGYCDPDYRETCVPTPKSDVYAFGVVMLEVLCGRKAIDTSKEEPILTLWVRKCSKKGDLKHIVDSNLLEGVGSISKYCLKEFFKLSHQCLLANPNERPAMAEVVEHLKSILATQEITIRANSERFMKKIKLKKNKVGGASLKSLEFHLYTVGGENRILHRFDIETINVATENFSTSNKISEDENGTMYKGKLASGQDITVYGSSDKTQYESYKNAASILVNVEHENLIQLLGFCIEGTNVYLVYDFAPYATLDHLIFDNNHGPLHQDQRYKILLGVAQVLLYLHKHAPVRVIHSDVKLASIIMDDSLNPKLSGFYFAKSTEMNETDYVMMDAPRWTMGHSAPEYTDRILTTKCDVFSFGVLVLETITGQRRRVRSTGTDLLLEEYVRRNLEEALSNIIDINVDSETRFLTIGLLCTQVDPQARPSMDEVVAMMLNTSDTLVSQIRAMNTSEWKRNVAEIKKRNGFVNKDYDANGIITGIRPR